MKAQIFKKIWLVMFGLMLMGTASAQLVIDAFEYEPANPTAGDLVRLKVLVRNTGGSTYGSGCTDKWGMVFTMTYNTGTYGAEDMFMWHDVTNITPLAAGESRWFYANNGNKGNNGNSWIAVAGTHTVRVRGDGGCTTNTQLPTKTFSNAITVAAAPCFPAAAVYTSGSTASLRATPWPVDTWIQWRNFDLLTNGNEGSDGCTFGKNSNQGGNFRGTGFSNDDPEMGWVRHNAWLSYTFQITQAGIYSFTSDGHRRGGNENDYVEYQVWQNGIQVNSSQIRSGVWGSSTSNHEVTSTSNITLAPGTYQLRVIFKAHDNNNNGADNRILQNKINTVCINPTSVTISGANSYVIDEVGASLSANVNGGSGAITYQWYNNGSTNSNTGGSAIPSATNQTYSPSTATVGTTYYYVIATRGGACPVTSAAHSVEVSMPVCDNADAKTLTLTPSSVCVGGTSVISVANPQSNVTYALWSDGTRVGGNIKFTGSNAVEWTTPALTTGTAFTLRIVYADGICPNANMNTQTVTVTPVATPVITDDMPVCRGDLNQLSIDNSAGCYWQTSAGGTSTQYPAFGDAKFIREGANTFYLRRFNGTCWSDGAAEVNVSNAEPDISAPEYDVVALRGSNSKSATNGNYMRDNNGTLIIGNTTLTNADKWLEIPSGEAGFFYYKNVATGNYLYNPGGSVCGGNVDWQTYRSVLTSTPPNANHTLANAYKWKQISKNEGGMMYSFVNKVNGFTLVGASTGAYDAANCLPGLSNKYEYHNNIMMYRESNGRGKDGADIPGLICGDLTLEVESSDVTHNSAKISWNDVGTGYAVSVCDGGDCLTFNTTANPGMFVAANAKVSITVPSLTPDTYYTYTVTPLSSTILPGEDDFLTESAISEVLESFTLKWGDAQDIAHPSGENRGVVTFTHISTDNEDCMEVYFKLYDAYPHADHVVVLEGDFAGGEGEKVLGTELDAQNKESAYICFDGGVKDWYGVIHIFARPTGSPEGSIARAVSGDYGSLIASYSLDISGGVSTGIVGTEKAPKELKDCFSVTGVKVNCNNAKGIVIKRYTDGSAEKVVK